jgi:hypothetical protein
MYKSKQVTSPSVLEGTVSQQYSLYLPDKQIREIVPKAKQLTSVSWPEFTGQTCFSVNTVN